MFKFQAFRRMFTYAVLSVYVLSIPMSANAMSPGRNGGSGSGGGNTQQALLAMQALLLLLQNGPGLLNQAAQAAPDIVGQLAQYFAPVALPPAPVPAPNPLVVTPLRPAAVPRGPMPTPDGHARLVPGENFFATPRTLGSHGVYVHTQDPVAFEPIDVERQPLTEEEAYRILVRHPNRQALLDLLPPPCPDFGGDTSTTSARDEKYRYAGKTKNPMKERFSKEVKDARKRDDRPSRHFQGLRGGHLRFGRAIFINTREQDNLAIERAVIRFIQGNWGRGLNSNGGSKSKKRSLEDDLCVSYAELDEDDLDSCLTEYCHEAKYQRKEDPDEDDDQDGGSSSDSSTFSPFGSQTQSSLAEVF